MKVLFVCTGNIFRSMAAEYCLKDYCYRHKITDISVDSCGVDTQPQKPRPETIERLRSHEVECSGHQYKSASKDLMVWADVVVAMGLDHQRILKSRFDVDAVMFNELVLGKHTGIKDIQEYNPAWLEHEDPEQIRIYCNKVIDYIYNSMEEFVAGLRALVEIANEDMT